MENLDIKILNMQEDDSKDYYQIDYKNKSGGWVWRSYFKKKTISSVLQFLRAKIKNSKNENFKAHELLYLDYIKHFSLKRECYEKTFLRKKYGY